MSEEGKVVEGRRLELECRAVVTTVTTQDRTGLGRVGRVRAGEISRTLTMLVAVDDEETATNQIGDDGSKIKISDRYQ